MHHRSNSFSADISTASEQSEPIDQEIDKIGVDEPSDHLDILRRIDEALQVNGFLNSGIPRPDRNVRAGRSSSPTIGRLSNPPVKTKPLSVETHRRVSSVTEGHVNFFNSGDTSSHRKHFHGVPLTHRREWNIRRPPYRKYKVTEEDCDLFNIQRESHSSVDEISSLSERKMISDAIEMLECNLELLLGYLD